jgi:hypothetical protein
MMYSIGMALIDTRNGRMAQIETVVRSRKGLLYTVQYETGEYRRYYETSLNEKFRPAYTNVLFVDFVLKRLVS